MARNVHISTKVTSLSLGIILVFAVLMGLLAVSGIMDVGKNIRNAFNEWSELDMVNSRMNLEEENKRRLQDLVHAAASHFYELNEKAKAGKITLEEAQNEAKRQVECMRYDSGKGYFWINSDDTTHVIMIMHPITPELNGQGVGLFRKEGKIIYAEDSNTPMFHQFVKVTRNSPTGGGFVRYLWPNPLNLQEWLPKLSYVLRFEPWGWIIGSGVYIDDLDKISEEKAARRDSISAQFSKTTSQQISEAIRTIILISIIVCVIGSIITILLLRGIVRPLKELVHATENIASGDFDFKLSPVKHHDEVGKLAESFSIMMRSFKEHIKKLTVTTAAKERIESELNISRKIQLDFTARLKPTFPDNPEFDIYAVIQPAEEVNCDYFDFFILGNNQLCIVVGDVCGTGVSATMYMSLTRTLIRTKAIHGLSTAQIMGRVNEDLSYENDDLMFATVFLGILDINSGKFQFSNAGHCLPFLYSEKEKEVKQLGYPDGLLLGIVEDFKYRNNEIILNPGDIVLAFTDGLTQAADKNNEIFGREQLKNLLTKYHPLKPEQLSKAILDEVNSFRGGLELEDDIALLSLRYNGTNLN